MVFNALHIHVHGGWRYFLLLNLLNWSKSALLAHHSLLSSNCSSLVLSIISHLLSVLFWEKVYLPLKANWFFKFRPSAASSVSSFLKRARSVLILKFMERHPRGLLIKPQLQSQRNKVRVKFKKESFLNVFLKGNDTEFFCTYVAGIIITLYESVIDKSSWRVFRLLSGFNSLYKLIHEKSSHFKE